MSAFGQLAGPAGRRPPPQPCTVQLCDAESGSCSNAARVRTGSLKGISKTFNTGKEQTNVLLQIIATCPFNAAANNVVYVDQVTLA